MLSEEKERLIQIDKEMVILFEERMEVARKLAEINLEHQSDVLDLDFEEEILQEALQHLHDEELEIPLKEFYRELMRLFRQKQLDWMHKMTSEE